MDGRIALIHMTPELLPLGFRLIIVFTPHEQAKGIQRDTGGYAVALAASMRYVFAGAPGQTMFTAADIGWAVGHSYGVYGPLIHGMQTILYEGLPIRPDGGIWCTASLS